MGAMMHIWVVNIVMYIVMDGVVDIFVVGWDQMEIMRSCMVWRDNMDIMG